MKRILFALALIAGLLSSGVSYASHAGKTEKAARGSTEISPLVFFDALVMQQSWELVSDIGTTPYTEMQTPVLPEGFKTVLEKPPHRRTGYSGLPVTAYN